MKAAKCFGFLIVSLSINVYAAPKTVSLPFTNVPIFGKNHEGIIFKYNMHGKPQRKIVCELSYVYKGWLEFRSNGTPSSSGVYGDADGIDKITLTAKGVDLGNQYHADIKGYAKVLSVKQEKAPNAAASCRYEAEDNI